jgi:hypothetical protein
VVAAARDTLEARRIGLPTGLLPEEVRALRRDEKITLAAWHTEIAGDDNGREWLPASIRLLGPDAQLALATDDDLLRDWTAREIRDCKADPWYFIQGYGSVLPDQPGPPIPFRLWPAQERVLDLILTERLLAILKARQLGLSWLALHFATHLIGLNPAGHNAVVLGLSQDGGYAKRLLERVRDDQRPAAAVPARHRGPRDRRQQDRTEARRPRPHGLAARHAGRAALVAGRPRDRRRVGVRPQRPGRPDAHRPPARGAADHPYQLRRRAPDEEGWGQTSPRPTQRPREGERLGGGVPAHSTHPDRDEGVARGRARELRHRRGLPRGAPRDRRRAPDRRGPRPLLQARGHRRRVKLGAELDAAARHRRDAATAGEALASRRRLGRERRGAAYLAARGGGVYVPPGETSAPASSPASRPSRFTRRRRAPGGRSPQRPAQPPIGELRYDAAGVQSQRTFLATARARFAPTSTPRRGPLAEGAVRQVQDRDGQATCGACSRSAPARAARPA